jgi:hypothetical protein
VHLTSALYGLENMVTAREEENQKVKNSYEGKKKL